MGNTIVSAAYHSARKITQPGKFEGEPVWLPDFWQDSLEGMGHEETLDDGTTVYLVPVRSWHITRHDATELKNIVAVAMVETDQGFVECYTLISRGYNECHDCGELILDDWRCDDCREGCSAGCRKSAEPRERGES